MPPCTAGLPQVWRKPRETYCEASVILALHGEVAAAVSAGGTVAVTCGTGATASVVPASACASAGSAWHSSRGRAPCRARLAAKHLRSMEVVSSLQPVWVCLWVAGFGSGEARRVRQGARCPPGPWSRQHMCRSQGSGGRPACRAARVRQASAWGGARWVAALAPHSPACARAPPCSKAPSSAAAGRGRGSRRPASRPS
ncbi:hypothetical protein D9M70_497550 [compost metagenome]